ncbi:hypothetical protein SDDV_ORF114 [Scale drop disease virus]
MDISENPSLIWSEQDVHTEEAQSEESGWTVVMSKNKRRKMKKALKDQEPYKYVDTSEWYAIPENFNQGMYDYHNYAKSVPMYK